jgi:hypothetical protein
MIFAGVINTGMMGMSFYCTKLAVILILHGSACWVLLYLDTHIAWKDKVVAEVQNFIAAHTNATSSDPIYQHLSTIPISALEDEMPVIESMLCETLCLLGSGTSIRRNLVDDDL